MNYPNLPYSQVQPVDLYSSQYSPDPKPQVTYPVPPHGSSRRGKLALRITVLTFILFAANVFFIVGLVVYIAILNHATITGLHVQTTASVNVINTITQAALKVMALSVPLTMSTCAHRAASRWLKGGPAAGPTPTQLGLGLSVLGAANIMALIRSSPHALRRTPGLAPFLRSALISLTILLLLDNVTSAVSLVLNATTVPANVRSSFDYTSVNGSEIMSRGFNETFCQMWANYYNYSSDTIAKSCGVFDASNAGSHAYKGYAIRTLQNSSETMAVSWADDNTAIMTSPASMRFAYSASTTGVRATCRSVTADCTDCRWDADIKALQCTNAQLGELEIDCVAGGVPYKPQRINATTTGFSSNTGGVLAEDGSVSSAISISKNPFHWGAVVDSTTYATDKRSSREGFFERTGWAVQYNQQNVVFCDVELLDVNYDFTPPSQYKITGSARMSLEHARRIAQTASDNRVPALVEPIVDGVGIDPNSSYVDAYGRQLAKVLLSMSSFVTVPQQTSRLLGGFQLGSRIPLPLLGSYLVLSGIFALYVLGVGLLAAATCSSDPLVEATQSYLVSPLHLIQQLHGTASVKPGALHEATGEDIFAAECESDRLAIGPQMAYDGSWFLGSRRS